MRKTATAAILAASTALATMPRAVHAMPQAKADDPVAMVAEIQTTFAAFKEKNDQALGSKVDDVVLNEHVDRINADLTKLTKALDAMNAAIAAAKIGGAAGGQSPEAAQHSSVFNTWFRRGDGAADAAMRDAEVSSMRELEVNAALTTQSDPDGGYLVPEQMDTEISRVLGTVSVLRQLARVMPMSAATYTKLVNLGGTASGWTGEEDARPETKGPTLAQIAIHAMELYANPAATQIMLDDARFDIAAWLAEEVSTEFSEKEGEAFILGDGVKRPRGILSYPTVENASYAWGKLGFKVSGHASAFPAASTTVSPADPLVDLYYALKSGYRANASWLMSDLVMGTVRKFKDADGAYIWAPPSATADVATILGKPVHNDDNMDPIGANKFPIAFGDFRRGYTILDRFGTRTLRDPYTNKPFVHFYTTKRVGGGVTDFASIKFLKIST